MIAEVLVGDEMTDVHIRDERESDSAAIFEVNAAAFGGGKECGEAKLVDSLREAGLAKISLVAEVDSTVVGHILFSPVTIESEERSVELLSLAPMAVSPEFQRTGIGSQLVEAGLVRCRDTEMPAVVVLGHPAFYPRFGFASDLALPLENPFGSGEAWMALELREGALSEVRGKVVYPQVFFELG